MFKTPYKTPIMCARLPGRRGQVGGRTGEGSAHPCHTHTHTHTHTHAVAYCRDELSAIVATAWVRRKGLARCSAPPHRLGQRGGTEASFVLPWTALGARRALHLPRPSDDLRRR